MNDVDISKLKSIVDVSADTIAKLSTYLEMLEKWNSKINLVGKSTIPTAWERHFIDSAQLWPLQQGFRIWVDVGSGAGFPGLVLAIIASEMNPEAVFHLVESDGRKCSFLRSVSRETNLGVKIHNCRIEDFALTDADIMSARALASVDKLLEYGEKILSPSGKLLLLKGKTCNIEIAEAEKRWNFKKDLFQSSTQHDGQIIRIADFKRVAAN